MSLPLDEALFDLDKFESELSTQPKQNIAHFRHALSQTYQEMSDRFWAGRSASELVYLQANFIDEILRHAWHQFFPQPDEHIALIAVGGYGRGDASSRGRG